MRSEDEGTVCCAWRLKTWGARRNGWLLTDARRVTSCAATASGLKDHSSQSASCWANGASVTHSTINYLCPQLVNERVAPPRREEKRRRKREIWERARVWERERKRKITLWEQENRLRRDRRRSDTNREAEHQSEEEEKTKTLCEKMRGGRRRGPGGKKASLKMCAISLWSLVLVNRVPAVLLFKVKYIHKLIKLPVMINVTEREWYYSSPAALSINVTLTSWHSKCKTLNNF